MAEYGEWTRKGATLTDVTAQEEYGVTRAFVVEGIRAGKLEFREVSIWGNPCLKILRCQLEDLIVALLGSEYLATQQALTELGQVKKEIGALKRKLAALEKRKIALEGAMCSRNSTAIAP